VGRDSETATIQHRARIRQHSRAAAYHDSIFLRIQRRQSEILGQLAGLDQCREPAVVRMRLAGYGRVVMEFLAYQFTEELVLAQIFDQVLDNGALAYPANTVNENHMLESFVDLRILDDAHERSRAGARAQQIEPLARLQVVKEKRAGWLTADKHRVPFADVLQAGRERAVRHLDAQKLQVLLMIRTSNAVRAQQRPVVDMQPHHDELPILEAQARIARGGEGELGIGPMMDLEYALRSYGCQDKVTCPISMGQNVTGHAVFRGLSWDIASFSLVMGRGGHLMSQNGSASLAGRTLFITGASRGIGLAIALRAAADGANIAIAAKTTQAHPKLPGTIYTAAAEIEAAGGRALPLAVDIRDEEQVTQAVARTVETFGGIDILVNNASAISPTLTPDTDMKRFDLMHQINTRGTFMCSKLCLPHLARSSNGHILMISPPLNMETRWFAPHVAYSIAKYGMSLCVLGLAGELKPQGTAVNALWPRTVIDTAALQVAMAKFAPAERRRVRKPQIMADAAHVILCANSREFTGNFCVDEQVLRGAGQTDLSRYRHDGVREEDLLPDFFL